MLAGARVAVIAASLGALCGAVYPTVKTENAASAQLVNFADAQLNAEFLTRRDALVTSCPDALGSYSFIELQGVRRIYSAAQQELTIEAKRARYYWAAGKRWIAGSPGPVLRYYIEESDGRQVLRAEQHVCARGEPQLRPDAAAIPK
jgi:hypothetical protein